MNLTFRLVQDQEHPHKFKATYPVIEVDSRSEVLPSNAFSVILMDRGLYAWFGPLPEGVKRLG